MRLVRLVFVIVLASTAQWAMGQITSRPADFMSTETTPEKAVNIYPNPATEWVDIEFRELPAEKVQLVVHNIIGNPIEVEKEIKSEHIIRVHVKELAAGYYLIAIKDDESQFKGTYKFLKR